ncbi:hypothetical protein GCM10007108_06860 [Thermogymnomonas acidicola]|uniref:Pirin family protein n=1 Tax=Thermogymnomonas acidicola TaxID=399579 RepID=A0AA37F960_9ARCH|nr:pirin family protein [Thermogymnomonas acidicola]GGM71372.1 hypothetical protein GCM10007108_06860 [Thermogymnomonas acidicola]
MVSGKVKFVQYDITGRTTMDGAGVRLRRIFGSQRTVSITDPFLLMDSFGSDNPADYINGFPWHPHRGIETVTYQLDGRTDHEDSVGNKGTIYPGDVQWMTAGSGIFHQEMPHGLERRNPRFQDSLTGNPDSVTGFQLWINIPADEKMKKPVYRGVTKKEIPVVKDDYGSTVRVIAGKYLDAEGTLQLNRRIDPKYFDVSMQKESRFVNYIGEGYTTIVFLISGKAYTEVDAELVPGHAYILSRENDMVSIETDEEPVRFIMIAGRPLNEEIAWYGPIVMNTQEQIEEALLDLQRGTFVRDREPVFL